VVPSSFMWVDLVVLWPRDARVSLPRSYLTLPVHPVVVFAVVDWAVSVRNCTGPLATGKAALADNLDNEYNREIRGRG
jgi:hypothetical protein